MQHGQTSGTPSAAPVHDAGTERLFELPVASLSSLTVLRDPEGGIVVPNHAREKFTGHQRVEVLGWLFRDLLALPERGATVAPRFTDLIGVRKLEVTLHPWHGLAERSREKRNLIPPAILTHCAERRWPSWPRASAGSARSLTAFENRFM